MASGTGTCHSLLPKFWQVHLTLRSHCSLSACLLCEHGWQWPWAVGERGNALLTASLYWSQARIMNCPLKSVAHPLMGDEELGLARPGSPGPFYSQGKDQPYQTESTESSGSFHLGKPWENVYKKKKSRENISKTLWHPPWRGEFQWKEFLFIGYWF